MRAKPEQTLHISTTKERGKSLGADLWVMKLSYGTRTACCLGQRFPSGESARLGIQRYAQYQTFGPVRITWHTAASRRIPVGNEARFGRAGFEILLCGYCQTVRPGGTTWTRRDSFLTRQPLPVRTWCGRIPPISKPGGRKLCSEFPRR